MADGSYYEGEFKEGEIEGYGFRYYASRGTSYTGQFHQGEPCGQGVFKYQDGTVYEGEFKDGKRSGKDEHPCMSDKDQLFVHSLLSADV